MKSIFTDKAVIPTLANLEEALGNSCEFWKQLFDYTIELYPKAISEWKFSGEKYGWGFRISDKKRVIVYLMPRDKYFKAGFVFGQKATDAIMQSGVNDDIKSELLSARVYAEGRGIRIDVNDGSNMDSIKALIKIKNSKQ